MPLWKKVGTSLLLSASAFIIIASILRVYYSLTVSTLALNIRPNH